MELLPSYHELKIQFPLIDSQRLFIEQNRQTIRDILSGKDPRLLMIVGPCSIHDKVSAEEFATHLHKLSQEVSNHFFLIMRAYCEKPRTIEGWKGLLYDPYLDGSNDLRTGITWTRKLLLELTNLHIPLATEFLDPLTAFYYQDLISWGSIGARTSSSQPHRQLASTLQIPIGIKNGTAGNVSAAINGAIFASNSHTYMGLSESGSPSIIRTLGNPDAHIVLRGGDNGPNYDPQSISAALQRLETAKLPLRLIVDCSHQNSEKRYDRQPYVFQSVLQQIVTGNSHIKGLMLESHLFAGSQCLINNRSNLKYGVSITDPCLDWHTTEQIILQGANYLAEHQLTEEGLTSRLSCAFAN